MTCNFRVGQKVVCVNDDFGNIGRGAKAGVTFPRRGSVYTVRNMLKSPATGKPSIRVAEIRNPKVFAAVRFTEAYFRAERFRPVVERGTEKGMSILRNLLNKTGKPVEVDA